MKRSGIFVVLLLFCCAGRLAAQPASIAGTVLEGELGTPLANANVFLANTPFGTGTGLDGRFRVTGVPPGVYTLVVSLVGYQVQTQQIQIGGTDSLRFTFQLQPRILETEEVLAVGVTPAEWRKLLAFFVREFIGQTPNADETRILNPEVINLRKDNVSRRLIASSDSIIRVENNALGYRLSIVLSNFEWTTDEGGGQYVVYPRFEAMDAVTRDVQEEWDKKRQRSYDGSLAHFLQSLVSGTLEQEGFAVHIGNLTALYNGLDHPLSGDEFSLSRVGSNALWRLSFEGWLRVEYRGTRRRTSYISLKKGVAFLDDHGHVASPLCFEMLGDWLEDRVAEMLPHN